MEESRARPGNWRDLITDEPFKRSDIIVIQDPMSLGDKYNFATFHHVKNNLKVNKEEQELLLKDPNYFINHNSATKRILEKMDEKGGEKEKGKE